MAERWVMVRVKAATHAALVRTRESMLRAHEMGSVCLDMDSQGRVSLDQVIDLLIGQRDYHAARRKRAAKKARGK